MTNLTKHPIASVREVWTVSLPMILAIMSGCLMFFVDRLILAQYSTEAMTAAASAGMVAALFQFGSITIVNIAEVFVGQHNGAKNFHLAAEPVWQMIWISLGTAALYTPLAFVCEIFIPKDLQEHGVPYLFWSMIFAFLWPLQSSLSAFFVGIARAKVVTYAALIGNVFNVGLSFVLVFGIQGYLKPMGTAGAAIGTAISMGIQTIYLFSFYLSKAYRDKYKTHHPCLNLDVMKAALKLGVPPGIGHMLEIGAWAAQLYIVTKAGKAHVIVTAIGQNIFVLFLFVFEGLSKGGLALASNYIGDNNARMVKRMLKSILKIHFIFVVIVGAILVYGQDLLISGFVDEDLPPDVYNEVYKFSKICLIWVWLYFLVDGIVWILGGILTAGGDTNTVMFGNTACAWLIGILPTYLYVGQGHGDPDSAWSISLIYATVNLIFFYWRYGQDKWIKLDLSQKLTSHAPAL